MNVNTKILNCPVCRHQLTADVDTLSINLALKNIINDLGIKKLYNETDSMIKSNNLQKTITYNNQCFDFYIWNEFNIIKGYKSQDYKINDIPSFLKNKLESNNNFNLYLFDIAKNENIYTKLN